MSNKEQALYYNMRGIEYLEKFISDFVSLLTHFLSSTRKKRVSKFGNKIVCPFEMLEGRNNNLLINVDRGRMTVNLDQARVYTFREKWTLWFLIVVCRFANSSTKRFFLRGCNCAYRQLIASWYVTCK